MNIKIALIIAGAIVLAVAIVFGTGRPDYPDLPKPVAPRPQADDADKETTG